MILSVILLKNSVISHCYNTQSFLLQYSAIFAILLSHFVFCHSELSHFCDPVSHFSLLQWTQSFFYRAQSFYDFVSHSRDLVSHFAIVLSHFMTLSAILQILSAICYMAGLMAQSRGARAGVGSREGTPPGLVRVAWSWARECRTKARVRGARLDNGWLCWLVGPLDLGDRSEGPSP
jgi:hypothetical protein